MPEYYGAGLRRGESDPDITSLFYDSRTPPSNPGEALFACVKGAHVDGHDLAGGAVAAGCAALLCERELPLDIPQLIVRNARAAMGEASALILGYPAKRLAMLAVTGTNGKTTSAYLTRSVFNAAGIRCGMLGTVVYDDGAAETDALHTTPEGPDVQELLASMLRNGCEACVMEASSHGLDQGRLAGCSYDAVGFSNLTPEHLEYHSSLESYFAAKRLLFTDYTRGEWAAAVNADDSYGQRLLGEFRDNARSFSLSPGSSADYRATITKYDLEGLTLEVIYPDGERRAVQSSLVGEYNASNILEALAMADIRQIGRDAAIKGIQNCSRVPGRLERYDLGNGVRVFIDFAHSTDSMEKVLRTLAPLAKGKIWALWGAGGDRTAMKRPVVGGLMAKYADRVVVTSDNPRSESPAAIAAQVESGVLACAEKKSGMLHEVILDRREAIFHALSGAAPNDIVLIAGKGPERFIDYGDRKEPFLDSGVLHEWAEKSGVEVA